MSGQTNSGRYVNLILIILAIFIALIRSRNAETESNNSNVQSIATYTFHDIKSNSADWQALATLLKSHDVGAEVTISTQKPLSKVIAEVSTYLDQIGVPFDAYKVIGKAGPHEEIQVAVYKIGRIKI